MSRVYNFSAGPAVLPQEVLEQAAAEMLDWHGSGMSVMEMSHRGPEFTTIIAEAQADLRELMNVPANYKILFLQGGGLAENAIVPMNLLGRKPQPAVIDFVHTGTWSGKSIKEAAKYAQVHIAASAQADASASGSGAGANSPAEFTWVPPRATWRLSSDAAYVHVCTNETIHGVEFSTAPDLGSDVPLVADVSSHILSRVIDVDRYGVLFGGAQKNIGPAGLTIVIVREDLLGHALPICPSAFDWKIVADNDSMYNTPPTYAIYIAGLVFKWLKRQGGIAAMEQRNIAKAALLYDAIDRSRLYVNPVNKPDRSRMNVPFFLRDESLNGAFLAAAKERRLLQLKGHKSVGGMRASLYNAMPIDGVQALVAFMQDFERVHGG